MSPVSETPDIAYSQVTSAEGSHYCSGRVDMRCLLEVHVLAAGPDCSNVPMYISFSPDLVAHVRQTASRYL